MTLLAVAVALAGLAISVMFVRERFSAASSLVATFALAAGSLLLWHLTGPAPWPAALALVTGALAALGWSQLGKAQPPMRQAAVAVALGLAAAVPWLGSPVRWASPAIPDVLWSSRGGILATSPMIVFALAGLWPLAKIDRARALSGAALFVIITFGVAARRVWWADAAPGPLPYIVLVPYFAAGAAAGFDALTAAIAHRPGRTVGALLALLLMWNIGLVALGQRGDYRLGEPQSFAALDAAEARTWHGWIGHPPSYPGNLLAALWNGVAPARVDLLSANRLLAAGATEGALDIGADDGWFLGDGWHAPEREGDRSFRWATLEASLDVPLDHRADLVVTMTVRPFEPPGGAPQRLELRVNGQPQPAVPLVSGWQELQLRVPRAAWRSGVNRIELKFATQGRPSDISGGGDTRWLAASVDAIRISSSNF